MKFISTWERDWGSWRTRLVWVSTPEYGASGGLERESAIDSLKNPLKFGMKELRYLEKNVSTLDKREKKLFQDMAGYFFSLAQNEGTKSLPPYMLVQIERSSLKSLLPKKLQEQIENTLDKQIQELAEFSAKDLNDANATSVARAAILYRRLRGKAWKDSKIKTIFEEVQKNLLGWAIDSLRQSSVSTQVEEAINGVSSRKSRMRALKKSEKVLIADIYNMFPRSESWVDHCDEKAAREYALEAFDELKKNPSDPTTALTWNIVEDWISNDDHDLASAVVEKFTPAELEIQFGRLRAVELLQFTKTQRIFLPAHLRALKSLKNDKEVLPSASNTEWGDLSEEKSNIEDINDKYDKLTKEYLSLRDKRFEDFIGNNPENKQVEKYNKSLSGEKTKWNELVKLVKELDLLEGEVVEEDKNLFVKKVEDRMDLGVDDNYGGLNDVIFAWSQEAQNIQKSKEAVMSDMPATKKYAEEITKLEKEKKEAETKREEAILELEQKEERYDIYSKSDEYLEKAESNFWNDLNSRVKDKHIHAADFDILWGEEFVSDVDEHLDNVPEKEKVMEFRSAFASILPGIFDGVEPLPEDRYDLWYTELDDKLSYENIISRLAEKGYHLREEFGDPQQICHLIEGAIKNFQGEIFDQIAPHISADKRDEFNAGWTRIHGHLDMGVVDPTVVHMEHVEYERDKQNTSVLIQQEQERNMAMIDSLRERRLDLEADQVAEAWEVRKKWYRNGGRMSAITHNGETKIFWAPGKDVLTELTLQTRGIKNEINKITDGGIRAKIADLKAELKELNKIDSNVEKEAKLNELKKGMAGVFTAWPAQKNSIKKLLKDHRTVMEQVLPNEDLAYEFADEIYNMADDWLEKLDEMMNDWKKSISGDVRGDEIGWKLVSDATQGLELVIDFDKGHFVQKSKKLDDYMEKDTETLQYLDEASFFDDESVDKAEFRKTYDEQADKFRSDLSGYESAFNNICYKVERDIRKLSDEDFTFKYGMMDKESMKEMLDGHNNQLSVFHQGSDKFLKPSYYNSWLRKYNSSPESRANALDEMTKFRDLASWSTEAKNQAVGMNKWIDEWQPGTKIKSSQYQKFALYDLYALVKQAIEVNQHKYDIRSGIAVANMGVGFFGRNSAWGKEFYRKAQEFEGSRVKEIEGEIEEDPWWENQEQLYNSNDQDEAKACINQLIAKGVFKWDDPKLWKTLMRLSGNAVNFSDADKHKDISEILEKCKDACEAIWSRETFKVWDNSLDSKTKSQEDSFGAEFQRFEHVSGGRERVLQGMLEKWASGDRTNTDPARFAGYLRVAFTKGKMNGGPNADSRWFYLIQGVKHGLLSRDFFGRVNDELLANMPYFDFFTDKSQAKKDGKLVPEGTPGSHVGGWSFDDYVSWANVLSQGCEGKFDVTSARKNTSKFFYEYVYQSEESRARLERMVRGGTKSFDHDDASLFAAGLGVESIRQMINKTSTDEDKYTPDFWRNIMAGYEPYFKGISEYIKSGDAEYGLDNPGWQKIRKRNFTEVGEKMKAMLLVFHSVLGNVNLTNREPIHFSESDFEKEEAYSAPANKSLDICDGFMKKVFSIADKSNEYAILFNNTEWASRKGLSPKAATPKEGDSSRELQNKLNDLVMGQAGGTVFSVENVEKFILGL